MLFKSKMKHSQFNESVTEHDETEYLNKISDQITEPAYLDQLKRAVDYACEAQDSTDVRPSSLNIALILKQLGVDTETLIAALLSDPRLRDTLNDLIIEKEFNPAISNLVSHVNWLNTFKECTENSNYLPPEAEALHHMLLATVDDVRAVLIKLAFRVQRLRHLKHESKQIQQCIARETLDIYAPLANRLGVSNLKWEMEDLAFRFNDPNTYTSLAKSMADKRSNREEYIINFVDYLDNRLSIAGINAKLYGRPKHLYSIWKKMQKKNMDLHELADLLAVRIIASDLVECYLILDMIHNQWQHLPHEFDDYIANPKDNGYQSIHTAIFGPDNQVVEIQIRTQEMNDFAEHGVAAHWRYKEGSKQDRALIRSISTLRRLLDNRIDDNTLLEEFKTEFFTDHVFVLTPKKEVVNLPKGATALDFAYSIHTDIGHQCTGAIVNGQRVPLSYPLKSGECIEILADPESQPHLDWLNDRKKYVHTIRARSSIRQWFNAFFKDDDKNLIVSSKTLQGLGNHTAILSGCCLPQVGDHIVGELQTDKTIKIHRKNCKTLKNDRANKKLQIIELNWGGEPPREKVKIHIDAFDRQGLLLDITSLLNQLQVNVIKANTETDLVDQSVAMELTLEINSLDEVKLLLKRIVRIPNVFNAEQIELEPER